jgi:hypothetical protein
MTRTIVDRTRGHGHGPIVRLMTLSTSEASRWPAPVPAVSSWALTLEPRVQCARLAGSTTCCYAEACRAVDVRPARWSHDWVDCRRQGRVKCGRRIRKNDDATRTAETLCVSAQKMRQIPQHVVGAIVPNHKHPFSCYGVSAPLVMTQ